MNLLTKIFGDGNKQYISTIEPIVQQINGFEPSIKELSDEALRAKTAEFRTQLTNGKSLDDLLPEAFACVREAAWRALNMRHFDVQLIGGVVLHRGQIAEMKTGEGKTLVATLPLYLNALESRGVHLVTVNDYLSQRDCGWMSPIFYALGLTCGVIIHDKAFVYDPEYSDENHTDERLRHLRPVSRQEAYKADIIYGTNNEFGFDYLRDNMVQDSTQMVQRDLRYAIVDEVDSILIDEARTPLIISAPDVESTEKYHQFAKIVTELKENEDYNVDEKMRAASLTEAGITKLEKILGVDNIYTERGIAEVHHIEQALRAHALYKLDRDYVVKDGEVIIVDEFTGRLMQGRRYSEGLHQAIEAKENVEVQRESRTLATITFQNYFRLYDKLAGMTGTAATEAEEFNKIYNLDVTVIPTNRPMNRQDLPDRMYKNEQGKFAAVVQEVKRLNALGQPVLIGTISIEKNEILADLLAREGVQAKVLNAKQHEREADILAQAGQRGAVTVATNMAGRGVDIKLGGDAAAPEVETEIKGFGGLHVLGTERHESRRIDNQLRGRAGRQGDPGSTQFYVSMEDDLMRIFGGERMKGIMERLQIPEDMPIENRLISRQLEGAQHKVEGFHFDTRKHLVEYDDVTNKHRETIYKKRRDIFSKDDLQDDILAMVQAEITTVVDFHTHDTDERTWNIEEIYEVVNTIFPVPAQTRLKLDDIAEQTLNGETATSARERLIGYLFKLAVEAFNSQVEKLVASVGDEQVIRRLFRSLLLRTIDTLWIEHLEALDHLRTGINLRGYGQRDPLVEYKREAYQLFKELLNLIQKEVVYSIYKLGVATELAPSMMQQAAQGGLTFKAPAKTMAEGQSAIAMAGGPTPQQKQVEARAASAPLDSMNYFDGQRVGRNDPCPCGSGKKFKKCHGA